MTEVFVNSLAEQIQQSRPSILPHIQVSATGQASASGEREDTVFNDVLFYISHASQHLGMIEALREHCSE